MIQFTRDFGYTMIHYYWHFQIWLRKYLVCWATLADGLVMVLTFSMVRPGLALKCASALSRYRFEKEKAGEIAPRFRKQLK